MISVAPGFWAGWILSITIVSLIALAWLSASVYFSADGADVTHEVWDETLREGTAPAPLWWFWLLVGLLITSVVYLILYPGLGTYRGALRWSQGGEIAASLASYDERFGPERARLAAAPAAELRQDADAMNAAWHVFNNHCTACHGPDARGQAQLFPDLGDDSWQWGGDEQQLAQTIAQGRQAVMPPWQAVLGDDGVAKVADYVLALANGSAPAEGDAATLYRTNCSACHGADGAGLAVLGGPALNDQSWTYGGSIGDVRASIALGRNGAMPAFGGRLDATQIKLLTAWLANGAVPLRGQ